MGKQLLASLTWADLGESLAEALLLVSVLALIWSWL